MRQRSIHQLKFVAIYFIGLMLSQVILFSNSAWADRLPDFTRLVEKNASAVVNIATMQKPKTNR